MRMPQVVLALAVLVTATTWRAAARRSRPGRAPRSPRVNGIAEVKGQVTVQVKGAPVAKRFVLRHPADAARWNGSLVIGAHGGSGGNNFDPTGKVIGTDETALDDVIGRHAVASGFAYASMDRDGAVSAREGLALTNQFAAIASGRGRQPPRSRPGAHVPGRPVDGRRHHARGGRGSGPDLRGHAHHRRRRRRPRHPDGAPGATGRAVAGRRSEARIRVSLPTDPKLTAFAEAIGTPVAARRLWPYTATNAVNAASRPPQPPGEDSTGRLMVPTIEVVGTWDDFVLQGTARLSAARRTEIEPPALSGRRRVAHVRR